MSTLLLDISFVVRSTVTREPFFEPAHRDLFFRQYFLPEARTILLAAPHSFHPFTPRDRDKNCHHPEKGPNLAQPEENKVCCNRGSRRLRFAVANTSTWQRLRRGSSGCATPARPRPPPPGLDPYHQARALPCLFRLFSHEAPW